MSAIGDISKALAELDAEDKRIVEEEGCDRGPFALPARPENLVAPIKAQAEKADTLRFELLRRRGAAHIELGDLPAAARDLKDALKLRPADTAVCATLDQLARRAADEGIELEPLPPAPPSALVEEDGGAEGDDADQDGDEEADEQAQAPGASNPMQDADAAASSHVNKTSVGTRTSAPPVGTRSSAQLKGDADKMFKEGRLGRAVTLYGKALKADAAAEWLEGAAVGGLLFRCQCLANRAACHLKMAQYKECVDDASAAIAATGAADSPETSSLLLKLLARRGMALCQLQKFAEAKLDYERAVKLDPSNVQLQHDLELILAQLK